eukprot:gene13066-15367_t
MYTISQPEGARMWFPCCDQLSEKCTWELDLTANADLVVVATGQLLEKVSSEDEKKNTFIYRQDVATCPAGIGMAVGPFEIHPDPFVQNVTHFCLPHRVADLHHTVAFISQAFTFYEEYLGAPFPFSSYKQVFVDEAGPPSSFATLAVLNTHLLHPPRVIDQAFETRSILSDLLVTQWFRWYVGPKTWSDNWLFHGLCVHVSWQLHKKMFGLNSYRLALFKEIDFVCYADTGALPPLYNDLFNHSVDVLSELHLRKSSLIIYMIEKRISEEGVRKVLNSMLVSQTNESIDTIIPTKKFLKMIKTLTGQDLKQFSEKWIQPEYMWIHQLELDRDVIAQSDALRGIRQFVSSNSLRAVFKFFSNPKYFYKVRVEAAYVISAMTCKETNYEGLDLMINYFKSQYFNPESHLLEENNFNDFSSYFIKKIIPISVSLMKDKEGRTPIEAIEFLIDLLKDNDNSTNPFSDNYYLASVISSFANISTSSEVLVKKIEKQIQRYLKFDQLYPCYKNTVTSACLASLCQLQATKLIGLDLQLFIDHMQYRYFEDIRKSAFACYYRLSYQFVVPTTSRTSTTHFMLDAFDRENSPVEFELAKKLLDEDTSDKDFREFIEKEKARKHRKHGASGSGSSRREHKEHHNDSIESIDKDVARDLTKERDREHRGISHKELDVASLGLDLENDEDFKKEQKSLPKYATALLPDSIKIVEHSWNGFPYCKTVYSCPFFGDRFMVCIESMHKEGNNEHENIFGCPPEILEQRIVDQIDIANDELDKKDYVRDEDPKLFHSDKTNRGPLDDPKWKEKAEPVMTCYKLVKVEFKVWGLQTRIENVIQTTPKTLFNDVLFYQEEKYKGISQEAFPDSVAQVLLTDIPDDDIEIKPDGLIYMPEIKYRRILNQAFGPGGWALKPFGPPVVDNGSLIRPYALYCLGRYVAESIGEMPYNESSPGALSFATATEAAKSNALVRCCKDIGIGSTLWEPNFIRQWKAKHATEKFYVNTRTQEKRKLWTLNNNPQVPYPWKETSFSASTPSSATSTATTATSQQTTPSFQQPPQQQQQQSSPLGVSTSPVQETIAYQGQVEPTAAKTETTSDEAADDEQEIDIDGVVPIQFKKYAGKTWRQVIGDRDGFQYIKWAAENMKGNPGLQANAIIDFIKQSQKS